MKINELIKQNNSNNQRREGKKRNKKNHLHVPESNPAYPARRVILSPLRYERIFIQFVNKYFIYSLSCGTSASERR